MRIGAVTTAAMLWEDSPTAAEAVLPLQAALSVHCGSHRQTGRASLCCAASYGTYCCRRARASVLVVVRRAALAMRGCPSPPPSSRTPKPKQPTRRGEGEGEEATTLPTATACPLTALPPPTSVGPAKGRVRARARREVTPDPEQEEGQGQEGRQ